MKSSTTLCCALLGTLLFTAVMPNARADKKTEAYIAQIRKAVNSNPYDSQVMYRLAITPEFDKIVLQAAKKGDDARVKELLAAAYSSDGRGNGSGGTALTWAVASGKREVVKALLSRPQDVNAGETNNWTALHQAANGNYDDMATLLLAKGANIESRTSDGATPLMFAAANKYATTTQLLLKRGAKVNAVNKAGRTALMCAAGAGRLEEVEILLANGANARLKDAKGHTALDHAALAPYASFSDAPGFLTEGMSEDLRRQAEADLKEIKRLLAEAMGNQLSPLPTL